MMNITHTRTEDGLALIIGTSLVAFGILLVKLGGVSLGGTAGLSLLVFHTLGIPFGVAFFIFNLPFYYIGFKRLGLKMVIRTLIAVSVLSVMSEIIPMMIDVQKINTLFTAIFANVVMAIGFLVLFRHRASLGGFNLLALFIQEHYKIPAGKIQMFMDACVLLLSLVYLPFVNFAVSLLGVIVLNMVITMNHRQDRYIGVS